MSTSHDPLHNTIDDNLSHTSIQVTDVNLDAIQNESEDIEIAPSPSPRTIQHYSTDEDVEGVDENAELLGNSHSHNHTTRRSSSLLGASDDDDDVNNYWNHSI